MGIFLRTLPFNTGRYFSAYMCFCLLYWPVTSSDHWNLHERFVYITVAGISDHWFTARTPVPCYWALVQCCHTLSLKSQYLFRAVNPVSFFSDWGRARTTERDHWRLWREHPSLNEKRKNGFQWCLSLSVPASASQEHTRTGPLVSCNQGNNSWSWPKA